MPQPQTLTLHLEGPREDEGYVQAQDFTAFLDHALGVFRRLEREQTGAPPTARVQTTFRIVDLEIGSATIVLQPSAPSNVDIGLMLAQFAEGVAAYRDRSTWHSRLDRAVLEEIGEMMAPVAHGRVRKATITVDELEVSVTATATALPFEVASPPESTILGIVSGFIDAINVHREPVFYLYPDSAPRITCRFDRSYMDDARRALRKYCRVHGLVTFTENNAHPARIDVERIEVAQDVSELRPLRSFVGTVPNLTGGQETVGYLRHLRDAED
jgi:hypothetical protein